MKFLSFFALSLLAFAFSVKAAGDEKSSALEKGGFITLKQNDGYALRSFVAGPADTRRNQKAARKITASISASANLRTLS
jgi:hypothetical protein